MIRLVADTFELIKVEKRLPAKISENRFLQSFGYLRQQFKNWITPLYAENCVLVKLSNLEHRYIYQILHIFSLSNLQVVFLWDSNLKNYIKLSHEGRRLFTIRNLKIISSYSNVLKPKLVVRAEEDKLDKFHNNPNEIIVETDVSKPIQEIDDETLMLPYCIHPALLQKYDQFHQDIQQLRCQERYISIFFSGNVKYSQSRYFIEQYYHVPSRDRCVQFLLENSKQLKVIEIHNPQQRQQIMTSPQQYQDYSVVLCTCKGSANNWLKELASANFFLALPGWYMLMCHNVIEAMSVGCIPILSYENWFSPTLIHGKTCFTYRKLEDLPKLITHINRMDKEEIVEMRAAVIDYFDHYLSPSRVADFLITYQGSVLRLFINNENWQTLQKINHNSILCRGGSLQPRLKSL